MVNITYNKNKHIGSDFDSFLEEEGIITEVTAVALKRMLVWQIKKEMEKQKINTTEMARKMNTSRAAVNRLLNPENISLTLKNLESAAHAVNKIISIELRDSL